MVRAPTGGRTTPLQLHTATPQHLRSVGTAAKHRAAFLIPKNNQLNFSKPQETAESEGYMAFFNSAVTVLQTLVVALGAGLGVWGVINLLEGYGNDNPGAKSQGMKQVKCLLRWQNSFDKAVFKTAHYVIFLLIFPIKR